MAARAVPRWRAGTVCPNPLGQHNSFRYICFLPLSRCPAGVDAAPVDTFESDIAVKRNYGMRDASLPLLEQGGAFIAVGALHLLGKEGLVELFRAAGYTVTPIE